MRNPQIVTFSTSPLTPDHATQWAQLRQQIAAASGLTWMPTPAELIDELEVTSTFDPARQTWAVWQDGQLIGYALVRVRDQPRHSGLNAIDLDGGVHPDHRGRGISSQLLEAAQVRGSKLALEHQPQAPLVYDAMVSSSDPISAELLADHGYEVVRYFIEMRHDLSSRQSEDERVRPYSSTWAEATRAAHNDAFRSHWGSGPASPQKWQKFLRSSGFRPDLSRIVTSADDVLAYAMVSSNRPGEAYLELVGTRAGAQGQGLGRAIITSTLAAIGSDGSFTTVGLDVDAANPSDAGRLYSSIGFNQAATTVTYERAHSR